MAEDNIPKPALNAFAALHRLGDVRLPVASDSALATRRSDGTLAIALWNYAPPAGTGPHYTPAPAQQPVKTFSLDVSSIRGSAHATVWRVDSDHGNVLKAYDAMGRPATPTREQIAQLQAAGRMAAPETLTVHHGKLQLTVPRYGLAVVEIR
jgi:xylan 1,4-beta-xylosidase